MVTEVLEKVSEIEEPKRGRPTLAERVPTATMIEYAKKGLSQAEIARLCGVSENTVQRRLKQVDLKDLKHFEENKHIILSMKQREALEALTPEKMEAASALQLGTLAGILMDKQRVQQGMATNIVEHRVITANLSDAIKNLKELGMLDSEVLDVSVEEND